MNAAIQEPSQAFPTGFTARTKACFGQLSYWDAWIDAGRPGVRLDMTSISAPAGREPGGHADRGSCMAIDTPRLSLLVAA